MRFVQPEPRIAPKVIASSDINIRMSGVDSVLIERLAVKIERHLRIGAEYILIATNNAHSDLFDLACATCHPKANNKKLLQQHLRVPQILPCFGEAQDICNRIVHVDAKPNKTLDDSEFRRLRGLWSNAPWKLIYNCPGAAAGRNAAGMHSMTNPVRARRLYFFRVLKYP